MAHIPKEIIEDLRKQATISKVIGNYLPLVKKGRFFSAVCPFHNDHDPSLSINDEKQIFKCFVCGAGGNCFSFVQRYKSLSFQESIFEVAKICNYPLDPNLLSSSNKPKINKFQKEYDLLNEVISVTKILLNSRNFKNVRNYLFERGITEELISYFQIGVIDDQNIIYRHLKEKGFEDQDIIDSKVCRLTNQGVFDIFKNRILFPIHDQYGNPLGFSARTFVGDDAKYINSENSKIYNKSRNLYNLNRALEDIRKSDRVYVLEGVFDVIAMYRAGFKNAICTLGTSLSKEHLNFLKNYTKNIIFNYDGDKAGQNATIKAGLVCMEEGFDVKVVKNTTTLDPDEIINKNGEKALKDLVSNEYSFVEFALDYYDNGLNTYQKQKEYVLKVGHIIEMIKDEIDRINFNIMLEERSGIKVSINKFKKTDEIGYNKKYLEVNHQALTSGLVKAEYNLLSQMMISENACQDFKQELGYLIDENNSKIANVILEQYRSYGEFDYSRLLDELEDDNLIKIVTDILMREDMVKKYEKPLVYDSIKIVKNELLKQKRNALMKKIKQRELNSDFEELDEILKELSEINRRLGGKNGN